MLKIDVYRRCLARIPPTVIAGKTRQGNRTQPPPSKKVVESIGQSPQDITTCKAGGFSRINKKILRYINVVETILFYYLPGCAGYKIIVCHK